MASIASDDSQLSSPCGKRLGEQVGRTPGIHNGITSLYLTIIWKGVQLITEVLHLSCLVSP